MAKVGISASTSTKRGRPALTPETRENQLISLAVDLAEQQLRDGTASSQVITHFLKLGTTRAELEKEKLRLENEKTKAQTTQIQSVDETRKIAEDAIKAMRNYQGFGDPDEYDY